MAAMDEFVAAADRTQPQRRGGRRRETTGAIAFIIHCIRGRKNTYGRVDPRKRAVVWPEASEFTLA